MKKSQFKNEIKSRRFKSGSYSAGITVIAIAIAIIVNLIVNALPASITKIDLSFNKMYSLTDTTKEYVKSLNEDVTIYVIAQKGEEDPEVMEVLDNYKALSSHIKIETIDPVLHPNFISQYTDENVSRGSLLVVSEKRNKLIAATDLYVTSMDYTTYQTQITGFDAEGQLTSAIHYVTTQKFPTVYILEGHGDAVLSSTLEALIDKSGIEIKSLNLLTAEAVPEDADGIILNGPEKDITEEEARKLQSYLENGGSALIIDGQLDTEHKNLNTILEYYGLKLTNGLVIEAEGGNYFYPYPYYLAPVLKAHSITNKLRTKGLTALMVNSQAIQILDNTRSSLTITPLLTTTEKGFLRVMENSSSQSIEKQEGDLDGPIHVGVAVEEVFDAIDTKLVIYSSALITNDSANQQVNGNNYQLIVNSLNWICNQENTISIEPKSFSIQNLQITVGQFNAWRTILVVIIPILILAGGFIVWFRRRRR